MWTEIRTSNQIASLKKDEELLHHPDGGGEKLSNPSGSENNSRVYRVQSFDEDLFILYSVSERHGNAYYSSMGIERGTLLNGRWWMRSMR